MKKKFHLYTVEELKKFKPGTVFEHKSLGMCIIMRNRHSGWNYVAFKNDYPDCWFLKDGVHPWDEPMRLIYNSNES
jgi:hypothetical protein